VGGCAEKSWFGEQSVLGGAGACADLAVAGGAVRKCGACRVVWAEV